MNDKTPKGDGNFLVSVTSTTMLILVMNDKTPKGDGNISRCFLVSTISTVKNDKTPKGDGNFFLLRLCFSH